MEVASGATVQISRVVTATEQDGDFNADNWQLSGA
jgi:hypothetical protein